MVSLPGNDHVSHDDPNADRRRRGPVGRARRLIITIVRSRWIAMFVVAFAVSWAFHQIEEIQNHKLERQQRIISCTITGVAHQQSTYPTRVQVEPILQRCTNQQGKE